MSTSAASVTRICGVVYRPSSREILIHGEGWVLWAEIERQVNEAFQKWRWRKVMTGVRIMDGHERREMDIRQAQQRRKGAA